MDKLEGASNSDSAYDSFHTDEEDEDNGVAVAGAALVAGSEVKRQSTQPPS